jgi:hypothetical protein
VAATVVGAAVIVGGVVAGAITLDDARAHAAVEVLRSPMDNATDTGEVRALKLAIAGKRVGLEDVTDAIAFVRSESDGSDFRLVTLLRLLEGYRDRLDPAATVALRDLLLDVRWWMDEPGMNPLVYWSENHQVLWASGEYLAGSRFPGERFRDGRMGADHAAGARDRLLFWLDQRWRFGFAEWDSHYYAEDAAALAGLVDFGPDDDVRARSEIVLDLLLLDMAAHTVRGEFIASAGRLYEANRTTGDEAIRRIVRHAFEDTDEVGASDAIDIDFLASGYRTPAVLAAIAADDATTVVTETFGRDPGEIAADDGLASPERRIMAAWGAEAFTNPETVDASIDWIRAHGLLANPFLAPFRQLDWRVLRSAGLLPLVSRALDLPTNGTALGRADVYAYRTADLELSTTQAYRPGGYGNQEAIVQLTLDPGLSLFHSHPAVRPGEPSPNGNSPGFWTGDGTLPVACQDGGISVAAYDLPERPGFGRSEVLAFTHLRVPLDRFDEVVLDGARLVLRYGSALVAVTGTTTMRQAGPDELVQDGRQTGWAIEVSSTRDETFEAFTDRVLGATVAADGRSMTYASGGRTVGASIDRGCTVDGAPIAAPYQRVPAPYATTSADGREVTVEFGGHRLVLDFEAGTRIAD